MVRVRSRGRARRALLGVVGLIVVLGVVASSWWVLVGAPRANEQAAADTADAFLAGWSAQDWPAVAARTMPPSGPAVDAHRAMVEQLEITSATYTPTRIDVERSTASVAFDADLELSGMGPLSYTGLFPMTRVDRAWQVDWSPSVLHPAMVEGAGFLRSRGWPERGRILDLAGEPLIAEQDRVVIGIVPRRVTEPEEAIRALVDAAGADEQAVRDLMARSDLPPGDFQPVVELERLAFTEADPALRPVPGILFQTTGEPQSAPFAASLVGRTAVLTAEEAEALGPPYRQGDVAGSSGIVLGRERALAGEPSLSAAIVDADGKVIEELLRVEAVPGRDLQLTLDRGLQQAAEQAVAGAPAPTALVVVDIPSGGLRAVANGPIGGFDRALQGRYPPGSTFKVVTSAALLGAGVGPDDTLRCPAEQRVGGRAFRNAGRFALGPISHRVALARSCNTAYVGQTGLLDDGVLLDAARAFGFVDPPAGLPVPAFSPSFPVPGDATELAAASIGQGRVEASPAHMASVAAAVAGGVWRSPILLVDDVQETRAIPGDHRALSDMMRAVVTEGTGQAADVPGPAVMGKTGSAEFGTGNPPQTHAWFIGFRGDLAFAVLVEGGGAGGAVAAPIAARFLELLS